MQLSPENLEFFGDNAELVNQILDKAREQRMREVEEMMAS